MIFGTDVSWFQSEKAPPRGPKINWPMLFNLGFRFFYAKASDGMVPDNAHAEHWMNATAAGFVGGSYQFGHPSMDAAQCATFFCNLVKDKLVPGNLRPVIDMESLNVDKKVPDNAGVWTYTWCKQLEALSGIKPIVYSGTYYMQAMLMQCPELKAYIIPAEDFWDAEYHGDNDPMNEPHHDYVAWQYAGNVSPISPVAGASAFTASMADFDRSKEPTLEKLLIKQAA